MGPLKRSRLNVLGIVFVACFIVLGSSTWAGDMVSKAQSLQLLEEDLAFVEKRYKALNEKNYYGKSSKTLEQAFQQSRVNFSMRYTNAWGSWVWTDWADTKGFYTHHAQALKKSIAVVKNNGTIDAWDLGYLMKGMEAWRAGDREIDRAYGQLIRSYTQRAQVLDQRNRVWKDIQKLMAISPRSASLEAQLQRHRTRHDSLTKENNAISDSIAQLKKQTLSGKYRNLILFSALNAKERVQVSEATVSAQLYGDDTAPCRQVRKFKPLTDQPNLAAQVQEAFDRWKTNPCGE